MDKQKALAKIKKCLALSRSANEHEAAQALKHAQALMKQYGLEQEDVDLADIAEIGRTASASRTLPEWHWALIHTVCRAFGTDHYVESGWADSRTVFVGTAHRAEIAAYAYEVLLRQLQAARRRYLERNLKYVRRRANKIYRADAFCMGWVKTVCGMVSEFALSAREKGLIERHLSRYVLRQGKSRAARGDAYTQAMANADYSLGRDAGKSAQLHHAMGGTAETVRRLEQSA